MAVDSRVVRRDSIANRHAPARQDSTQRRLTEDYGDSLRDPETVVASSGGQQNDKVASHRRRLGVGVRSSSLPNILFMEVDSASLAYADRHFPLTRGLLKHRRLRTDSNGGVECDGDVCAADFSLFSLVGPNSIANQVR